MENFETLQQPTKPGRESPKSRLVIENLDPDDHLLKLFPGIVKEHVARYTFAAKYFNNLRTAPNNSDVVVDLASGRGYGSDILKKILGNQATVIGIEIGKAYTNKAAEKYSKNLNKSPDFIQADVRNVPLPEGCANFVTAFEITEHLPQKDQARFLKDSVARILKPGGVALISVPMRYSFRMKGNHIMRSGASSNPHHLYEPTPDEMREYIRNAGLVITDEFGQVIVSKSSADKVVHLSRFFPLLPIYAWMLPRDRTVKHLEDINKVPLTYVFVTAKPSDQSILTKK